MDYNEIKNKIQNNKIVITGPHFSGTAVCAKALAHDLGYQFFGQETINGDSYEMAIELIEANSHFVLQAPGLCHRAHELPVAIVMMVRPFHEIVINENANDWKKQRKRELLKYGVSGKNVKHKIISILKYDRWYRYQRQLCTEAYEVDYYSLKNHPLWDENKSIW